MTIISVTIEVLELIILVPIFFVVLKVTYGGVELTIDGSRVKHRIVSICVSVIAVVGMKQNMVTIVLLPGAVLGTIFFLIPTASFIACYHKNRAKKHKKRWSR